MTDPCSPTTENPEVIDVAPEPEKVGATAKPGKKKTTRRKTPKVKPEPGAEVAVVESGPVSMPKTGMTLLQLGVRPEEVIDIGSSLAKHLNKIIEHPSRPLFTSVKGKKHVHVEGWTTMGAMLGIVPREVESKRLDDQTWETTVELIKLTDGLVVGRSSHICSKREKAWKYRDDYAIKSMSATRAVGKSFRLGFSWIMVLAGYSPTPEEEMRFAEDTPQKAPFDDEPVAKGQVEQKPKPIAKPDPDNVYTASNLHKVQLAQMFKDANLFDVAAMRLISQWLKDGEMTFKHAGDLIYLLKRYRVTPTDMPIIANNLLELSVPQVEEYLINFSAGGSDSGKSE